MEKVYEKAIKAGAESVYKPSKKPWGQTMSYVRDPDGHLVSFSSHKPLQQPCPEGAEGSQKK